MNKILEVKNLQVNYGLVQAVKNIEISLSEKTISVILGNNSAGKTTLLKAIMGLLDTDEIEEGEIFFNGINLLNKEPEEIVGLGIGFVPEGRELFPELTVKENLYLGAYLNKTDKKKLFDWIYDLFPALADRKKHMAGYLSGGEQQMLSIARALMNNPSLLLLDEPSLGLSPLLVKNLYALFLDLVKEGITILLIEQNIQQALNIAHQMYLMDEGIFVLKNHSKEKFLSDLEYRKHFLGV